MPNENEKQARALAKLALELEILQTQQTLWKLRAKAKQLRITEVKRQIAEVRR